MYYVSSSCVVEESWGQKQEGKEDVICVMCIEVLQYLLEHDYNLNSLVVVVGAVHGPRCAFRNSNIRQH